VHVSNWRCLWRCHIIN